MKNLFLFLLLTCLLSCSSTHEMKEIQIPSSYVSDIIIDGIPNESSWERATKISHFQNPWNRQAEPYTEVNLLWNGKELYFYFMAHDKEVVLADTFKTEQDVSDEDRVEFFFSPELPLTQYYSLEMDPLGRILDYKVKYYRMFDRTWNAGDHLRWTGKLTSNGYCVEGCIDNILLQEVSGGRSCFYLGAYRGEISKDNHGNIKYEWLCIRDPQLPEPDFHVAETFIKVTLK